MRRISNKLILKAVLLGLWLGFMPVRSVAAPHDRCLHWLDGAVQVAWCTEISEHMTSSVGGADRWWRVTGSHTRNGRGVAGDKLVAVAWGGDWFSNPSSCVGYTGPDGVATCNLSLPADTGAAKLAVTIATLTQYYQPEVYRKYLPLAVVNE